MTLKRLVSRRLAVIAVAALAVAVGTGAAVAAATDVFDPKAEREAFQSAVAEKLGVTTDQLEDAYKAAALERLDAAVAAGRITEEQAEMMRARIQSGEFPGAGGFMGGRGMHGGGGMHLGAAAEYLGLDLSALVERLRAGESLADVAKAQSKSVDGLEKAILADAKANLDQAVEDGRITAAQRDAKLERLEARIGDMIEGTGGPGMGRHDKGGFGPGAGLRGGFGAGAGGSMWSPPDA